MQKVIIYGAGQIGVITMWYMQIEYDILGFADSDVRKQTIGGGGG